MKKMIITIFALLVSSFALAEERRLECQVIFYIKKEITGRDYPYRAHTISFNPIASKKIIIPLDGTEKFVTDHILYEVKGHGLSITPREKIAFDYHYDNGNIFGESVIFNFTTKKREKSNMGQVRYKFLEQLGSSRLESHVSWGDRVFVPKCNLIEE